MPQRDWLMIILMIAYPVAIFGALAIVLAADALIRLTQRQLRLREHELRERIR